MPRAELVKCTWKSLFFSVIIKQIKIPYKWSNSKSHYTITRLKLVNKLGIKADNLSSPK